MATPKQNLPTLTLTQAGKEITINEAFYMVDALLVGAVNSVSVSDPSGLSPVNGSAYVVGDTAVNEWTGEEGNIAVYSNGEWFFAPAHHGMIVFSTDGLNQLWINNGTGGASAWVPWGLYALLNYGKDFYIGGPSNLGVGDKDWESEGMEQGAEFELFRQSVSAGIMAHSATTGQGAWVHLRCGSRDYRFENDGVTLRLQREGVPIHEFFETYTKVNHGLAQAAGGGQNVEVLTADKVLAVNSAPFQKLDPGAASRNVDMPTAADSTGLQFRLVNSGSGVNLTIRDSTGSALFDLTPGQATWIGCDGTSWVNMGIETVTL